jgi:hypothetical protein
VSDPASSSSITRYLASSRTALVLYGSLAAFGAYFCMYAFRKPVAALTYADLPPGALFGAGALEPKTLFLLSQLFGYCLSKYLGTRICAEVGRPRLGAYLAGSILIALFALLLFAVLPPSLKPLALLLNGIPLGLIWGFVVRYLEGRSTSELLVAALSASFIIASGETKRVGLTLVASGVPEFWMPFVTGLIFLAPFLIFVRLLSLMPGPDGEDEQLRSKRDVMDKKSRHAFLKRFLPGLIPLILCYVFLTAYRDYRDNYQADIFLELGIADPAAFSRTERPVAVIVLATLAVLYFIRNNIAALAATYGVMIAGFALLAGATVLYDRRTISPEIWMTCTGLGAYLAYVPFGAILFDRTIAVTRFAGTAVFAIYLADASGYTGSFAIQLYKDLFAAEADRLQFFRTITYALATIGIPLLVLAMAYFLRQKPPSVTEPTP